MTESFRSLSSIFLEQLQNNQNHSIQNLHFVRIPNLI